MNPAKPANDSSETGPNPRRQFITHSAAAAAVLCAPALIARAGTPVVFGYSGVSDYVSVFVAVEQGFFTKRGIEVEPRLIPLNATIVPGIHSGSLHMGGPTTPSYLLAVDGGLDHVVVAGGGTTSKKFTDAGLVARAGSGIRTAADCVGKKIGVPGIGGLLHITFRYWLQQNKVDFTKVTYIETPFPQHADLIRAGSVDAVVTVGTFLTRIVESGSGYVASFYPTFLPEGNPSLVHAAKREWANANPTVVKGFRDAVVEAAAFMARPENDVKVRAAAGKYLKLPPEVAAKMQISPPLPVVELRHLQWWGRVMKDQNMLKSDIAYANLILS